MWKIYVVYMWYREQLPLLDPLAAWTSCQQGTDWAFCLLPLKAGTSSIHPLMNPMLSFSCMSDTHISDCSNKTSVLTLMPNQNHATHHQNQHETKTKEKNHEHELQTHTHNMLYTQQVMAYEHTIMHSKEKTEIPQALLPNTLFWRTVSTSSTATRRQTEKETKATETFSNETSTQARQKKGKQKAQKR